MRLEHHRNSIEKQKRIFIMNKEVEEKAKMQRLLEEKEARLLKAERKAKSALKEKSEGRLYKKNTHLNQVQVRLLNISKEFENTITKEMER